MFPMANAGFFKRGSQIDLFDPILHLDPNDPLSYPGSGTDWFDLTANNNDFTLVNSPTLNNDSTGDYFSFNGTSQYAERAASLVNSGDFEIIMVFKKPSNSGFSGLLEWAFASNRRTGAGFLDDNPFVTSIITYTRFAATPLLNQWQMMNFAGNVTLNNGASREVLENLNSLSRVVTPGATTTTLSPITRIANLTVSTNFLLEVDIALVLVYDKKLTSAERLGIYNGYKSRFTLP